MERCQICGDPTLGRTHCPYCGAITSSHLRTMLRRIAAAKKARLARAGR